MSTFPTIAISPSGSFSHEPAMINQLFDAGLYRYHIYKAEATEQSIAEILEGVAPKYLSKVTLHSHYHLVLAYGVGGIHYAQDHRIVLGEDYSAKVQLYQSFGVKVSTTVDEEDGAPADYALIIDSKISSEKEDSIFLLSEELAFIGRKPIAIYLDEVLKNSTLDQICETLTNRISIK